MNPNRIWAIGTVLVIGAVLGLGWLLGVSPLLTQTAEAETQRAGVEQANLAQQAVLTQMKADYAGLDGLKAELATQKLSVPSEVDSDVIYSFFAGAQFGTGAPIDSIITGEAQLYGALPNGEVAPAPAATPAPDATAPAAPASDGTAPVAPAPGATSIPGLYTVPITIVFTKEATVAQVLSFAWAMQNGPRLFLVSSIVRGTGTGETSEATTTLTASMFVMSNPDSTPGSSAGDLDDLLGQVPVPVFKPWPASKDGTGATPNPTSTPTPGATPTPTGGASATPTPTP